MERGAGARGFPAWLSRGIRSIVLAALFVAAPSAAQERSFRRPRLIGTAEGLSHNAVHSLAQDGRGFLWIGTQAGLNRYDGRDILVYRADADDPEALAHDFITALAADAAGTLWVGTLRGLHRMREDGSFARVPLAGGERDARVTALLVGGDDSLWIGSDRGLYRQPREGAPEAKPLARSGGGAALDTPIIRDLQADEAGGIWVLSEGEERLLHRLGANGEPVEMHRVAEPITTFLPSSDGSVRVDLEGPVDPASLSRSSAAGTSPERRPTFFLRARQGMWVGLLDGLVHGGEEGRWSRLSLPARQLANETISALIDRRGDLWVWTYGGLVHWAAVEPGIVAVSEEDTGIGSVSSVAPAADGTLWLGTYGEGVARVEPARSRVIERIFRDGERTLDPCDDYVWSLEPFADGLLVATRTGLCRLTASEVVPVAVPASPDPGVASLAVEPDRLIVATASAVYERRHGSDRWRQLAATGAFPTALHMEEDGTIWVGTEFANGDLLRIREARVDRWPGIAVSGIWDIERDRDGRLWLATGSGLALFDESTEAVRSVALPPGAGTVHYSLATDDGGRLWVGTNDGLLSVRPGDPALDGARVFQGQDRLGNVEFNRHGDRRLADGRIAFAGMSGVTIIDPDDVIAEEPRRPVSVLRVQVSGGRRTLDLRPRGLRELVLRPDDHAVTLELGIVEPGYRVPSRIRYRLDPLESDWVDGGVRPSVRYTTVPPGEYVFRARAADGGPELRLDLAVLPPFWATGWFRVGVLAALVGIAAIAYRLRVRRLLEIEQMRLRIADDLHDELGSELSGIALTSGLLADDASLTDPARRRLRDIEESSYRASDGLRDIVWYTNPEKDSVAALVTRIRDLASRMLRGIDHEVIAPEDGAPDLHMRIRRDVYLAVKELLANVVRHAGARRVTVKVQVIDGQLELRVSDDGRGFDPRGVRGGTGLASLRRRAGEVGAIVEVESAPGDGTRVRLAAPLQPSRGSETTT